MADDVTPSDVKARRFEMARRGYDRSQVDAYLVSLADDIEQLNARLERRKTNELKVGLDDPEALALELGAIGTEVASILETARAAADGMRRRANEDVTAWRTTTERETKELSADALEQSQSMRAAAWNEGSSMLSSSLAEATSLVEVAKEDALFIRAEAEREAIRLTGDAKRDREELIRGARLESEEMIESARGESDGMLAVASQQAEQAQERARALEDRRAELLTELESTRASISNLEEEIDSRRQAMEVPAPIAEPEPDSGFHSTSDVGSVRIVAQSRSVTLKPVDAEELVADVVALRSSAAVGPVEDEPDSEAPIEPETVAVIAPPPVEESKPEIRPVPDEPASDEAVSSKAVPDEIGSLFASLREGTEEEPEKAPETPIAEAPIPEAPAVEEVTPEPPPEANSEPDSSDATLIPLQNAVLKDIKRALIDLQNDTLEHLRTDHEWTPTKAFTNKFKAPFGDLAMSITGSKADGTDAAKEFSTDLHAAVSGAISKARESGAGDRQVASSASRVFRMWRADESERRVLDAATGLSSRG
jgi:DivIVA domain-containing protein